MPEFFALSRTEILYLVPLPLSILVVILVLWGVYEVNCKFIEVSALCLFSLAVGFFVIGEVGNRIVLVGWPQLILYTAICVVSAGLAALVYGLFFRRKRSTTVAESVPGIEMNTNAPLKPDIVESNPLMTKCSVCGREIAKEAKICPGCGAKNKRPQNKKPLIVGVVAVAVVAVVILGLGASGTKLTESQSAACKEADELLTELANLATNNGMQSKIKKIDGKIVYIATIDYAVTLDDSNAETFAVYVMPAVEKILHPENIYVVLYLNENGSETYRLIDSQLDPSILH